MSQMNSAMNFLPEDYVEKRQAARAAVVFIGLLLVVIGGIVGAYQYTQWQMKSIFEARDHANQEYEEKSKLVAEKEELDRQKARIVSKVETTSTLMERVRRSYLLATLTELKPKTMHFVSMDLSSKELIEPVQSNADLEKARAAQAGQPEPVRVPKYDVIFKLVGTAPTDAEVAKYLSHIQTHPLLMDVNLLYSEEYKRDKEEKPMRRFSIEMHLNPKADMRMEVVTAVPKGN